MRTERINQRIFSDTIDIFIPKNWNEMSDSQLKYFAFLSTQFDNEMAKCFFLIRCSGLIVKNKIGKEFLCDYRGRKVYVKPEELVAGIEQLAFLDKPYAIRPSEMQGNKAVNCLLQEGFTFFDFLRTDSFFQSYLKNQNQEYVVRMANYLYRNDKGNYAKMKKLNDTEVAIVLLWYIGIKAELAKFFPQYFRPTSSESKESAEINLMEMTDAQIRALTGGDVTKEKEVLNMQCWRCFAELNAKAREAEELKRLYKK